MQEPGHDSMDYGNQHYGPTGADNDSATGKNGQSLDDMLMGAPTSFPGGVPSTGQQEPKSGS